MIVERATLSNLIPIDNAPEAPALSPHDPNARGRKAMARPTWIDRFLSSDAARLNPEAALRILARHGVATDGGNVIARADDRPDVEGQLVGRPPPPGGN